MPTEPGTMPSAHFRVDVRHFRPVGSALPCHASLALLTHGPGTDHLSYAGVDVGARGSCISIRDNNDTGDVPIELNFYLAAGEHNFIGVAVEEIETPFVPLPPAQADRFPSVIIDTYGPTSETPPLRRLRLQHSRYPIWTPLPDLGFRLSLLLQCEQTGRVGSMTFLVVSNWGFQSPPRPLPPSNVRVTIG